MQNTAFSTNKTLNIKGRLIDLHEPKIMGILNVTPDSFYDGGRFLNDAAILQQAEKMIKEGAAFIDVGGYSSRPGADEVPQEEELKRSTHAIRLIVNVFPEIIISIDTFRSVVAHAAVQEGASMINDISGGALDPEMFDTVARLNVPYILMHMLGSPQTMTTHSEYNDLVKEMLDYFHPRVFALHQKQVKDIIIDPGFGFAKTKHQNFELLHHLEDFKILGKPILVGLSRKSMIWKTLNIEPGDALNGTTSLHTIALLKGADILRVHDVKEAAEVIKLYKTLTYKHPVKNLNS